jgi:phospholipid/cholesterol/gamma-HCH transport system ATP-binding protein
MPITRTASNQLALIASEQKNAVSSGTPSELQASTDPLVLQFLRGEPDGPIPFDTAARSRATEEAA